ncbi:MAG TPA: 50S ribosomal protein L10 [Capillimicrobium sp.]|nr:50S ribosomal protein L10 [Capillimicrobium sp.]
MNREQKAAAIAEIATDLQEAQAVFAVDYRGISVPQAAELRAKLRESDTRFRVVKNTLTERAADQVGAEAIKPLLEGPTALAFVRGDAAAAAKALADYAKATDLLPFKGGLMEGNALDPDQIRAISRLPSRDVLYGQLVGIVASPISGLARTLQALISGLAIQLGQIQEQGLVGQGAAAAEPAAAAEAPAETPEASTDADAGDQPPAEETPDQDAEAPETATSTEEPAEGADDSSATTSNDEE